MELLRFIIIIIIILGVELLRFEIRLHKIGLMSSPKNKLKRKRKHKIGLMAQGN